MLKHVRRRREENRLDKHSDFSEFRQHYPVSVGFQYDVSAQMLAGGDYGVKPPFDEQTNAELRRLGARWDLVDKSWRVHRSLFPEILDVMERAHDREKQSLDEYGLLEVGLGNKPSIRWSRAG